MITKIKQITELDMWEKINLKQNEFDVSYDEALIFIEQFCQSAYENDFKNLQNNYQVQVGLLF